MRDISYEILDLLEQYGADPEGIRKALETEESPEVLYALSPVRENLLEWYGWNPEGTVLQIGADYGALTGVLARSVKAVTVWDVRDEDLEVVRRRYPEWENIQLLKDGGVPKREGIPQFPEAAYDHIVIPELRRDLIPGGDEAGALALAASLKRSLKPGGKLILACFNRIGLRIFAGAEPDGETVALSWRLLGDLSRLWEGKGADEECRPSRIYYPVPDHRLPTAIYSDARLPEKGELTNLSVAYDRPGYRYFSEESGFDELLREGQFERLADSYLAIWEKPNHERDDLCKV